MRKRRFWIGGLILLSLLAGCGSTDVESSAKPSSAVEKNTKETNGALQETGLHGGRYWAPI